MPQEIMPTLTVIVSDFKSLTKHKEAYPLLKAVEACLACCAACFVGIIEGMVEYFNRYCLPSTTFNLMKFTTDC
jgi:hypothetical protein